jgi:glycosyltransferase involved in cell wall biosynthesis
VKFLLVNHEYPPVGGGAATASCAIAHNLSALGHDVVVLTASYAGLPYRGKEKAVEIHRIRCLRKQADRSSLFEMMTFMIAALLSLPFVLAKHRPDAILIFFLLPSGPIGAIAKLFFGLPYVVSLRGGDVPGLVSQLNLIHKTVAPLRRFVLKHARAVVANSDGLRKLSEAADRYPIRVIPNGVDADFFRPDGAGFRRDRSHGPLRILFVGRFQEQKNLPFLLRQFARLPLGRFELHLVGDGPQKKTLRDLAKQLGLEGSIVWHGWLPRAALPQVYQSADCLVNPSLYEGMPNVVLEAMACGLPVVASKVAGNDALVLDGETGFLFELEEPAGLIFALMQLYDVDLRLRMGTCGRARAEEFFSWKSVASDYADLLSSNERYG